MAEKHYLQVTEKHFELAVGAVADLVAVEPNTVAEQQSTAKQETTKAPIFPEAFRSDTVFCESSANSSAPPVGSEQTPLSRGKTALTAEMVADLVAVDFQLAELLGIWPMLTDDQKSVVITFVKSQISD